MDKIYRIAIASCLRKIVATLSLYNLKELLTKSVAVLPEDSSVKSIVIKEIIKNDHLTETSLKATQEKLKEIIGKYPVDKRAPYQTTVLEPIQYVFNKEMFVPSKLIKTLTEQKEQLSKSEKDIKQTQKAVKEFSSIPSAPATLG